MHWSELIGGDVVISPPSAWQKRFVASDIDGRAAHRHAGRSARSSTISIAASPISAAPTTRTACASTSSTTFAPTRRTLRQFLAACDDLRAAGARRDDSESRHANDAGFADDGAGAGALSERAVQRARRPAAAVLRRRVRHLRPRQRRRHRPGARSDERSAALLPVPQRAGDGAHRGGVREDVEPACARWRARRRSAPARPTWSPAPPARRSTACRCCCCRATSSPIACRRRCCSSSSRAQTQDVSVNDCFRPVSRYWDRIYRAEQLLTALPEAMRVLTSPAETGAVTLALPQDTQTEAFDYPDAFFDERVWTIPRPRGDAAAIARAADGDSREPSAADHRRRRRALQRGDRRAARSSPKRPASRWPKPRPARARSPWDHPLALGAHRRHRHASPPTGWRATPIWSSPSARGSADFTTMSKTAFAHPDVRFVAHQRVRDGCVQARARFRSWPTRAPRSTSCAALARLSRPTRDYRETVDALRRDVERGSRSRHRRQRGAAPFAQARGDRRRQRVRAAAGRGGLRGRQPAGRSAQAVAGARAQHLSPRIRLLVHGLRDRRRARREDGRSVARRVT